MITNTLSAGHLQLPTTPDIPCNFRVQLSILWLVINCLCKTSYCLERLWKQPKEKFSILGHMMKRKKRKSKNKKCNQDHRRSLHCWLKRNICPPPVVDILVVDTNSSYSLLVGRGGEPLERATRVFLKRQLLANSNRDEIKFILAYQGWLTLWN